MTIQHEGSRSIFLAVPEPLCGVSVSSRGSLDLPVWRQRKSKRCDVFVRIGCVPLRYPRAWKKAER